jgi:hypothetical protein
MNQTQSIIVYRNPLEQQLWEGGYVGLFLCVGILFVVITVALLKVVSVCVGDWKVNSNSWISWAIMAVAAVITGLVFLSL